MWGKSKKQNHDILGQVRIAAPCPASWDAMEGDDKVRFCGQCRLNVYNLSGMDKKAAETLVSQTEGRLCVRYFERTDGTILTKDCPTGLRLARRKLAYAASCTLVMLTASLQAFGLQQDKPAAKEQKETLRQDSDKWRSQQNKTIQKTLDRVDPPNRRLMGEVVPVRIPKKDVLIPKREIMGKIAMPDRKPAAGDTKIKENTTPKKP
jgi:hypothetical protein